MVYEVTDCILNHWLAWAAELCELSRVCGDSVVQFCNHLSCFRQRLRGERSRGVAILCMRSEREHLTAKSHKPNMVLLVPSYHLGDVLDVRQAHRLEITLSQLMVCRLRTIGAVFGWVFWLVWVLQRMAVFKDRLDAACP